MSILVPPAPSSAEGAYQYPDAGCGLPQHGSVRQLTDADGTVAQARFYTPFGAPEAAYGQPAVGTFGFAGEQEDAASGLTFLRARYYDPTTGRFLTRDPYPAYASVLGTLHRYAYVGNNPISRVDPSGLRWASPQTGAARRIRSPGRGAPLSYRPGMTIPGRPWRPEQRISKAVRFSKSNSYDMTQVAGDRARAVGAINEHAQDLSRGKAQAQCAPTGFWEGLKENFKPGEVLPYLWNEVRTNPYLNQKIAPEEGLKIAVFAAIAVGATVLTGGAAAPFVLAGAGMTMSAAYGAQVYANHQAGLEGSAMWQADPVMVMGAGFRGAAAGGIAGVVAPLVGALGSSMVANAVSGAGSQVLGQVLQDAITQGWGNWSPAEVYIQQAVAGAVGGIVGGAVGQLANAAGLGGVFTGMLTGSSAGVATQLTSNVLSGRPWYEGVPMAAATGYVGGGVAGGVLGAMGHSAPGIARVLVGGMAGGGVSAGVQALMNVARGDPWHVGVGQAFGIGFGSALIDAGLDYWADTSVGQRGRPVRGAGGDADGGRRPGAVDADGRLRRLSAEEWDAHAGRPTYIQRMGGEPDRAYAYARGVDPTVRPVDVEGANRPILPIEWNPGAQRWRASADFEFNDKRYGKGDFVPTDWGQYAPRRPGLSPRDDCGWTTGQFTNDEIAFWQEMARQRGKRIVVGGSGAETDRGFLRRYFAGKLGYDIPKNEQWRFNKSYSTWVDTGRPADIDVWALSGLTDAETSAIKKRFDVENVDLYDAKKYPDSSAFGPDGESAGALVFEPDGRIWRIPAARQDEVITLYHATNSGGAKNIRRVGIDLSYGRSEADFGQGFYVTRNRAQAKKWAQRAARIFGGEPEVLEFRVRRSELEQLGGLRFIEPGQDWQAFVTSHRTSGTPMHSYDFVEGPVAMQIKGVWVPHSETTYHQLSVHTQRAVEILWKGFVP